MSICHKPRLLVLCTVSTGLDAIAEVHRKGHYIAGIVGLHPEKGDSEAISGYTDIAGFAEALDIPSYYVQSYALRNEQDRETIETIEYDIIWVAGWQRLVPFWLIDKSKLGVLGVHGSPDGINGGRGRSPQNWALLLNCKQFDLALFLITAGVDEGPIVAQRTFFYRPNDDIRVSYYRTALATAEMVCEVLENPELLSKASAQPAEAFYYPQRRPEDGTVDWYQPAETISRHCRALTRPYPGLKTNDGEIAITIWNCEPFDDQFDGRPGIISHCFYTGDFLVNCLNGRLLVRDWSSIDASWKPRPNISLMGVSIVSQLQLIVDRHKRRYPEQTISPRIVYQISRG